MFPALKPQLLVMTQYYELTAADILFRGGMFLVSYYCINLLVRIFSKPFADKKKEKRIFRVL